jgi:hypothetical protein
VLAVEAIAVELKCELFVGLSLAVNSQKRSHCERIFTRKLPGDNAEKVFHSARFVFAVRQVYSK